jgi:hypothetical protein
MEKQYIFLGVEDEQSAGYEHLPQFRLAFFIFFQKYPSNSLAKDLIIFGNLEKKPSSSA